MELCLFRHGRTTWNALGRYQGQAETDLDELGWAQARSVAMRCREMQPLAVYTSDLGRCVAVAEQIESMTSVDKTEDQRLREFDFGAWSGLTRPEIADKFPEEWQAWRAGDQDVRPGGGESANILRERVVSFVEHVRASHTDGIVVAVSHAAWIRSAVRWALGGPIAGVGTPTQGSLTVLSLGRERGVTLESFNDRGHLLGLAPIDKESPAPAVY